MEPLLILVTLIAITFGVINYTLRNQERARAQMLEQRVPTLEKAKTEADDEYRKRKDALEARTAELADVKEKLREAKKKLHEEKGVNRQDEIERAKAQAEREGASAVEAARREASEARDQARRYKAELESSGKANRRPRPESSEAKPAAVGRSRSSPAVSVTIVSPVTRIWAPVPRRISACSSSSSIRSARSCSAGQRAPPAAP